MPRDVNWAVLVDYDAGNLDDATDARRNGDHGCTDRSASHVDTRTPQNPPNT